MLVVNDFISEDVLNQNCRVGKIYPKCESGKLCKPTDVFDIIEACEICKKQQ